MLEWIKDICSALLLYLMSFFVGGNKPLHFPSRSVRLEGVLGEGGFSTVLAAQDSKTNDRYAVKKMAAQTHVEETMVKNELEALRRFVHPNIVRLVDVVNKTEEGTTFYYLLFPLCPRGTLRDSLNEILEGRRHKQPLVEVLRDFAKICKAINALHEFNPSYIHQDIKPENILIENNGNPLLTDMGSVRLAEREVGSRNQALAIIDEAAQFCTMPYRAPELFDPPRGAKLDCRTDVWSIGCLLFASWFGFSPFECEFSQGKPKIAECSLSRILAKMPRPLDSNNTNNSDDKLVCDLSEWVLEMDFTVRPFTSDVIIRVEEAIANISGNSGKASSSA